MIWAIIVMICTGDECRVIREFPMFGFNTKEYCEEFREIRMTPIEGLRSGERLETKCDYIKDRWSK